MIRHTRPPVPAGFPPKKIRRAAQQVRDAQSAENARAHWGDWKPHFYRAQHHRCGWCDVEETGDVGAVEHVAPKGAVHTLGAPGQEVDDSTHFVGRDFQPRHAVGYWWLAYNWDNWVFACNRCNSWKGALYPVAEDPHPAPDEAVPVTPMLLHPFGPDDPDDHLEIGEVGEIRPRSPRGGATIQTCGLDRESLRHKRLQVVTRVNRLCERLMESQGDDDIAQLLKAELPDEVELASVARSVVRRVLGVCWSELHDR